MNTALFGRVPLPPPAPGAFVLARLDGPRAGRATDASITRRIKGMHGDGVTLNVFAHIGGCPIRERAQLKLSLRALDLAHIRTRIVLPAPKPGNPCLELAQLALDGPHLANLAANVPLRDVAVEQVGAVQANHGFHFS